MGVWTKADNVTAFDDFAQAPRVIEQGYPHEWRGLRAVRGAAMLPCAAAERAVLAG